MSGDAAAASAMKGAMPQNWLAVSRFYSVDD